MSNFERPSLGWESLQLNRKQQHQESNQEEQGEESEDPCSSIRELNIAPAPKKNAASGSGKLVTGATVPNTAPSPATTAMNYHRMNNCVYRKLLVCVFLRNLSVCASPLSLTVSG